MRTGKQIKDDVVVVVQKHNAEVKARENRKLRKRKQKMELVVDFLGTVSFFGFIYSLVIFFG